MPAGDARQLLAACAKLYKEESYQDCLIVLLQLIVAYDFAFGVFFMAANCAQQLVNSRLAVQLYHYILGEETLSQDQRELTLEALIKIYFNLRDYDQAHAYASQLKKVNIGNTVVQIAECEYAMSSYLANQQLLRQMALANRSGDQFTTNLLLYYRYSIEIMLGLDTEASYSGFVKLFHAEPRLQHTLLHIYQVYRSVVKEDPTAVGRYVLSESTSARHRLLLYYDLLDERNTIRNQLKAKGESEEANAVLKNELSLVEQRIFSLQSNELKLMDSVLASIGSDTLNIFCITDHHGKQILSVSQFKKSLDNIIDGYLRLYCGSESWEYKYTLFAFLCREIQAHDFEAHYIYRDIECIYHNFAAIAYKELLYDCDRETDDIKGVLYDVLVASLAIHQVKAGNGDYNLEQAITCVENEQIEDELLTPTTYNLETLLLVSQFTNNVNLALNLYLNILDIKNSSTNKIRYALNCVQLFMRKLACHNRGTEEHTQMKELIYNLLMRRKDFSEFIAKATAKELILYINLINNCQFNKIEQIVGELSDVRFLGTEASIYSSVIRLYYYANQVEYLHAEKIKSKLYSRNGYNSQYILQSQDTQTQSKMQYYLHEEIKRYNEEVDKITMKIMSEGRYTNNEVLTNVLLEFGSIVLIEEFEEEDQFELLIDIYNNVQFEDKQVEISCLFLLIKVSQLFKSDEFVELFSIKYIVLRYGIGRSEQSNLLEVLSDVDRLHGDQFDRDMIVVLLSIINVLMSVCCEEKEAASEAMKVIELAFCCIIKSEERLGRYKILEYNLCNIKHFIINEHNAGLDPDVPAEILNYTPYNQSLEEVRESNRQLKNSELLYESKALVKFAGSQDINYDQYEDEIDLFDELFEVSMRSSVPGE